MSEKADQGRDVEQSPETQRWWLGRSRRLLQMNLRAEDLARDPAEIVRLAHRYCADVLLFNTGGLLANYPSSHPTQRRNPWMRGDPLAVVLEEAAKHNIKVISRFDFSKLHEEVIAHYPEWASRRADGRPMVFNGYHQVCPSSGYQQRVIFEVLEDLLRRYPVDGLFFNYFGYHEADYAGRVNGPCHCDACAQAWAKEGQGPLPTLESDRPLRARHATWCRHRAIALARSVTALVHRLRPSTLVTTYADDGVDLAASESNSDFRRASPEWSYTASEHVRAVEDTWASMRSMDISIGFASITHRHIGVSPRLAELRQVQHLIQGGWLATAVIGRTDDQLDRSVLGPIERWYRVHHDHAAILAESRSLADVVILRPDGGSNDDYRGWIRILSENTIPYAVVQAEKLLSDDLPRPLPGYKLCIVPDGVGLPKPALDEIDRFVETGGKLIWCGGPGELVHPSDLPRCLGIGSDLTREAIPDASYFMLVPGDWDLLTGFSTDLPLLPALGDYLRGHGPNERSLLRLSPQVSYGPPEECRLGAIDATRPGGQLCPFGQGEAIWLPWAPAHLYHRWGHWSHAAFVVSLLKRLGCPQPIQHNAGPLLELSYRAWPGGLWVGLINHTGWQGPSYHPPVAMTDISLTVHIPEQFGPVQRVQLLPSVRDLAFEQIAGNTYRVQINRLEFAGFLVFHTDRSTFTGTQP